MPEKLSAYAKGVMGEVTAARFLIAKGMKELQRRYRCAAGEIDLIMLDHDVLVFVEVKFRHHGTLVSAQAAVTPAKQRRIIQTALWYLNEHPQHASRLMRFDVVSLSGESCIEHIPNAFQGAGW